MRESMRESISRVKSAQVSVICTFGIAKSKVKQVMDVK